jgi:carboxylesterase
MPLLPGAEPYHHDGGQIGVLLCHGFTGCPQSLRPWAEHLAGQGLTVSLPRLPGHGTRWQELALTKWTDWYAEVDRAFLDLRGRCDQVFVMGLSMGATLSLRLAEQHGTEVAGLVVVNPSLLTKNRMQSLLPLLKLVVPSIKGVADDIKKPGVHEVAYDRTPLRAAASLAELWRVTRADLQRIEQPVLVLRSRVDHVVEPENAALLQASIRSTDVEERVLENSYHVATLDNDAETIFAASVEFVRRLTPAARAGG